MPGVDAELSLHRLHVDPSFRLVKQKKRNFSDEKNLAIQKEVEELVKADALRELQLVDGSVGHEIFDFLNASRGYHQILLHNDDQEKTAFITEYHY
ncbi:hypothetical protein LIER_43182 [Lithospermum erythrorhizon]|uniref:Uncharacterized protein n=1 Tax=Lithospermum erythrorhizon TaxID=34254 RepID=A0AAV3PNN7_LITER